MIPIGASYLENICSKCHPWPIRMVVIIMLLVDAWWCMKHHHKLHGLWFDNNNYAIFFDRFVWNKHGCNSYICIVWILMSCILFGHECHMLFELFKHGCFMFIHVVYTWKSYTELLCLNNAWHSCLNNINLWNNIFCTNLKWTHEAYKFVMIIMN
jgi:hypothetical protein